MSEPSLWSFISHAGPVVKFVMLLLMIASITSWTMIIQRTLYFKQLRQDAKRFEQEFWSGVDLDELSHELESQNPRTGLSAIFYDGFKEFKRLHQRHSRIQTTETIQRAMRITTTQAIEDLEKHLSFLATVGSTSPYVGLFGTVWGIMTAFRALGSASQATIAMVAPGIAEALIATAIGLFAAIPAVIAYNRLSSSAERLANQYETFQEELTMVFEHQSTQVQEPEEIEA